MKILLPLKALICLNLLFFVQFAEAQNKINEKITQNLPQIQNTTRYTPLKAVTADEELKSRIPDEVLNQKQFFQVQSQSIQSIKTNNSEYLRMSVPMEGQDVELQLYRANIFTENFQAELTSNPGENLKIDRGIHYRGIVAGAPNSLATISFIGDQIVGGIHYNDKQMSLVKLRNEDYHILFENKNLNHTLDFDCQVLPIPDSELSNQIDEAVEKSGSLLDCVGVHIEVDQSFYQDQDSDLTSTTDYVYALFAQVTMMFANENIPVAISFLRIWDTPDPYGAGTELTDLRNQAYGTTNGNLVHLLHAQGGGGVAYLNGLCDNTFNVGVSNIFGFFNNVPTYSWDVMVVTHEIGHNLSSSHTHDCVWNGNSTQIDDCGNKFFDEDGDATTSPEPCYDNTNQIIPPNGGTVMSYCHLFGGVGINLALGFGQQPGDQIRAFTASQNCGNFCTVVCPAQVVTPYARTEDLCAGITTYTLPTSYPELVLDNNSAATYKWSIGNYISAGGTPVSATTYTLTNPPGCAPVTELFFLNTGCFTDGLNDIDAGILTLNIYPDPAQFTATDLVTVSSENTCDAPIISPNCAGVTVSPDPANPTFPVSNGQNGTANYTITYTPPTGNPNCCLLDASGEVIVNGDFEASPPQTGWTELEEVPTGTPNPNPFGIIGVSNNSLNGTNDAWFGGWGGTSYLTISQDIYISPTCSTAELTFDFGMSCVDNAGITLSIAVDGVILGSLTCTDQFSGSILPYDLIAAGAPTGNVTFTLIGEEDGTGTDSPYIYVDNVSILTTGCTTPIVCDFPVSATYDCQQACAGLDLDINFDGNPEQTSWEIIDTSTGSIAASGGTYGSQTGGSNLNLPSVACLPDGCYELTFYDAANDGMCPRRTTTVLTGINIATLGLGGVFNGIPRVGSCGNYTLYAADGSVITSGGGRFGASETNSFCIVGGIPQFNYQPDNIYERQSTLDNSTVDIRITPILTSNDITVFTTLDEMDHAQINVVDINGKIMQQHVQSSNSTNELQLSVSDFPAGIYFVQMVANDTVLVEKFVKR